MEESGQQYGERSLRDHYNSVVDNKEQKIELKQYVVKALCAYLGFMDFHEFGLRYGNMDASSKSKSNSWVENISKKTLIAISLSVAAIVIVLVLTTMNRQKFMIWDVDHYVEVPLDLDKYSLSNIKVYNEDRITNFKKINPDCNSQFFDEEGVESLWYGKSKKGELEYFTSLAKHPETGKTLKAITPYMIKKHICESYHK